MLYLYKFVSTNRSAPSLAEADRVRLGRTEWLDGEPVCTGWATTTDADHLEACLAHDDMIVDHSLLDEADEPDRCRAIRRFMRK